MPRVSVLVVNFQAGPYLTECLRSLVLQTMAAFEVIVVDNGSNDGSFAAAREAVAEDGRFHFETPGRNLGFAAGNNYAAQRATAHWLALLNPDAFAAPDWLEQLLAAADQCPDTAMFGSTQVNAFAPERLDGCGDEYFAAGLPWRSGHGWPLTSLPKTQLRPVFGPCAAAALYRRDAFEAMSGFDESFFCYVEDVDLAFRMRLAGHHCLQVTEAVISHVGGGSSGGGTSDFARFQGTRNLVWCFFKNMPGVLFWPLLPAHAVTLLLLWGRAIWRGQAGVVTSALVVAFRTLPWRQRRVVQSGRRVSWWVIARALVWSPLTYARRGAVDR